MSAANVPETVFVTVDGFDYQVIYTPHKFGGVISHFEFRHMVDGQESTLACPLTETGYRSHFFPPILADNYDSTEAAAIAAIKSQQDLKAYHAAERERKAEEEAARQMPLF